MSDDIHRTILSSTFFNEMVYVFSQRSRWGGDRICPNAPDEGGARLQSRLARVRISKSDSGSPKGGIRADSRLVLSYGSTMSGSPTAGRSAPDRKSEICFAEVVRFQRPTRSRVPAPRDQKKNWNKRLAKIA